MSTYAETVPEDASPNQSSTDSRAELAIPDQVEQRILLIRSCQVMLDADLAELYQVETRVLVQAVKRNLDRFPEDFMFQLSDKELEDWRSQIVMSNPAAKMGLRRKPYAFTEHGILMLSSVLRSQRAVQVNIEIMRTFVRLRRLLASHEVLARKLADLEKNYDAKFRVVFDTLRELLRSPDPPLRPIGFVQPGKAAARR